MLEKAIEKIKVEMDSNKNNPYIKVVGEFLLQHLQVNPSSAERIVQEGKTINKSLDEMRKVAQKKQTQNYAMFTPQEGFEIVLKYFGIEGAAPINISKPIESVQDPANKDKKPSVEFNVELDF